MIKTILFDVDGTIIDTEYVMTYSLQKTLCEELEKEIPIKELHYILGIPGREAIKKFVNTEEEEETLLSKWGENVLLLADNAQVFPHIEETLQTLHVKGIQLGLVTSKTKEEMKNEFDRFNLNLPVVLVNFNILKNISKFLQNVVVLDLIEHCKPVICFQIYSLAL